MVLQNLTGQAERTGNAEQRKKRKRDEYEKIDAGREARGKRDALKILGFYGSIFVKI